MDKIRYKVVLLPDLTSTGLLHSKIISYKPKRWNHPAEPVQKGKDGPGGLWCNKSRGQARSLQKYLKKTHGLDSICFICIIDKILFESSYRTKTNSLFLLDQVY